VRNINNSRKRNISDQMSYMTIEELQQTYNNVVEIKLSDQQTLHSLIDKFLYYKHKFSIIGYSEDLLMVIIKF